MRGIVPQAIASGSNSRAASSQDHDPNPRRSQNPSSNNRSLSHSVGTSNLTRISESPSTSSQVPVVVPLPSTVTRKEVPEAFPQEAPPPETTATLPNASPPLTRIPDTPEGLPWSPTPPFPTSSSSPLYSPSDISIAPDSKTVGEISFGPPPILGGAGNPVRRAISGVSTPSNSVECDGIGFNTTSTGGVSEKKEEQLDTFPVSPPLVSEEETLPLPIQTGASSPNLPSLTVDTEETKPKEIGDPTDYNQSDVSWMLFVYFFPELIFFFFFAFLEKVAAALGVLEETEELDSLMLVQPPTPSSVYPSPIPPRPAYFVGPPSKIGAFHREPTDRPTTPEGSSPVSSSGDFASPRGTTILPALADKHAEERASGAMVGRSRSMSQKSEEEKEEHSPEDDRGHLYRSDEVLLPPTPPPRDPPRAAMEAKASEGVSEQLVVDTSSPLGEINPPQSPLAVPFLAPLPARHTSPSPSQLTVMPEETPREVPTTIESSSTPPEPLSLPLEVPAVVASSREQEAPLAVSGKRCLFELA